MSRRTRRNHRRAPSSSSTARGGEPSAAGSSANEQQQEQDEEEEDDHSGAEANANTNAAAAEASTSEKETVTPNTTRRSKRTRRPTAKSVIAAASTHVRRRKQQPPPGGGGGAGAAAGEAAKSSKEEENGTSDGGDDDDDNDDDDDRDSEEDPSKEPQNSKSSSKQSESGDDNSCSNNESEKEVQDNAAAAAATKKRTRASKKPSLRGKMTTTLSKREKDSKEGDNSSDDGSDDEPLTKLRASKRSAALNKRQTTTRKGGGDSKSGGDYSPEESEKEFKTTTDAAAADTLGGSDDEPLTHLKAAAKRTTTRKAPTKKSASTSGAAAAANPDNGSEKDSSKTGDSYCWDEDNSDDEPLTKLRVARESKRKGRRSKPSQPKAADDESEKEGSSDEDEEDHKEPLTTKSSKTAGDRDSSDKGGGGESDQDPPKKPLVSKRSARKRRTKKEREESREKNDDDQESEDDEPDDKELLTKKSSKSSGGISDQGDENDENPPKKPRASKLSARKRHTKKGRQESTEADNGSDDDQGNDDAPPKKTRASGRTAAKPSKGSESAGGDSSDEGKESSNEQESDEDAAEKPKESEKEESAEKVSEVKKGKIDSLKEQESDGEEDGSGKDEEDPPRDQRKSRRVSGRMPRNKGKSRVRSNGQESEESSSKISRFPKKSQRKKASKNGDSKVDGSADQNKGSDNDRESEVSSSKNQSESRSSSRKKPVGGSASRSAESSDEDSESKAEKDHEEISHISAENVVARDDKKPEEAGASDPEQESDDEPLGALRSSRRLTQKIPSKKGELSDGQNSDKGDNSGNEPDSDDASSKGKRATSRSSRKQKKVGPSGGERSEGGDKSADDERGSRRSARRPKRRRLDQEESSRDKATSGDNDSLPSNRAGEESEDKQGAGEQTSTEKLETIEALDEGGGAEEKISEMSPPPQEAPEKNAAISPPPKGAPEEDEEMTDEQIPLPSVEGLHNSMREEDRDKENSDLGVANEFQAGNNLTSTMEMDDAVADEDNPPEKPENVEEKTDPDNSKIGKDETEDATPQYREQFSDSHDRDSETGLPSKTLEVDAHTKRTSEGPNEVTSIDAERPADETGVDVEVRNSSDADEVAASEQDERPADSSTKPDETDHTDLKSEAQSSSNTNDGKPDNWDQEVEDVSESVPENKDSETVESEVVPAVDVGSCKTRVGDSGIHVMEAPIEEDPTSSPATGVPTETKATEEPIETDKEGPESEDHVVDSEVTGGASQSDSIVDGPGTKPLETPRASENQSEAKVETISTEVEVPHGKEPGTRSPDDIVDEDRDAEMKPEGEIGTDVPPNVLGADLCKDALHSPPQADAEEREEYPGDLANARLTRDGTLTDGLNNLTVGSAEDGKDELAPPSGVETQEEGEREEGGGVYVAKEKEKSLQEDGTGNEVVEEHEGEKEKVLNTTVGREDSEAINSENEEQVEATVSYKSESVAMELDKSTEQDKGISPETKGGSPSEEDVVKISGDRASNAERSTPSFEEDDVKNIVSDPKEILVTSHSGDETQGEVAEKSEMCGFADNAVASPTSPDNVVLVVSNVGSPKNLIERNSKGGTENEQSNTQDLEGLSENKLPGEGPLMKKAEQPVPQHLSNVQREASADSHGDTTPATPVRDIHEKRGNHFMEVFSSPIRQEDIERHQRTSEEKRTDPKPAGLEVSVHNSTLVEDSDGDDEQFHDAQMELPSEPPSPQVPVEATKGGRSTQDFSPTALAISKLPLSVIHEGSRQSDEVRIIGLHPRKPQETIAEDVVEKLSPDYPNANQEMSLPAALSLAVGGAQESKRGTNAEILQTKVESAPEAASTSINKQEEEPTWKRSREVVESTAPRGYGSHDLDQDADQGPDPKRARQEVETGILPAIGGRTEDKELLGLDGTNEALRIEDEHAELPLDTNEEDASTIGQAPFEGLAREKLDRIKAVLYSEGNRVHRGRGFERLFAEYWDALSLRLSDRLSSHTSERCRVAVKTFLKTRKLRRLHNKFVIGLMGRATRQTAPLREVSQHIPVKWCDRIKRCKSERRQRLHAANDPDRSAAVLNAPAETTPFYREAWAAEGSFAHLTPFAAREEVENGVQEVMAEAPSSSIPGALVVDPLVRDIVQEDGMRVTENAIWLLVVAVKEHTKATLKQVVDVKEASENGHILPRTKNYPHTLASTSKASTSGKANPSKHVATTVASKKRKQLTSLDICAASTSSPLAGIGSLGGSLSRYAFERCLHSAYDANPIIPEPHFVQVHKFITSEIASAAKQIKLEPVKEVVPSQMPAVSIPPPSVRPFIKSKPPPASVPPVQIAPPIAVPALPKQQPVEPVAAVTQAPVPSQPATSRPVPQNEPKAAAGACVPRGLGRGAKNLAALKMRAATDTPPLPKGDELPLPAAPMAPDASSNSSTATQIQVSPIPTPPAPPLVSTEQDPKNTSNAINPTPATTVPVTVPAPVAAESVPANAPAETKPDVTSTSEPPADNAPEPIRPVMQRRGKGFGTKNLAAMKMRSIQRTGTSVDASDKADEEQDPEPENGETGDTEGSSKAQEADPKPSEGNDASLLTKSESKDNPNEKETGTAGGNPQNQTTIAQQT